MKNKKPYSDRRWTDIPKATVIGHEESSKEDKKKYEDEFAEILKKEGIIKK